MSAVNASIMAVDCAMDLLTKYSTALSDVHARGCFEISSIEQMTVLKRFENQEKMEEVLSEMRSLTYDSENDDVHGNYNEQSARLQILQDRQEKYDLLVERVTPQCDEKLTAWDTTYRHYLSLIDCGKRMMGEYIFQLNKIRNGEGYIYDGINGRPEYYVVIVDSTKYPQTAEHIRIAIKKGMPEYVTLGRDEASDRRKESLKGIKTRPEYDRDEWPMACFIEGGAGADVCYIDRGDNRGSGSNIGQQMRGIPNGSMIRLRII